MIQMKLLWLGLYAAPLLLSGLPARENLIDRTDLRLTEPIRGIDKQAALVIRLDDIQVAPLRSSEAYLRRVIPKGTINAWICDKQNENCANLEDLGPFFSDENHYSLILESKYGINTKEEFYFIHIITKRKIGKILLLWDEFGRS